MIRQWLKLTSFISLFMGTSVSFAAEQVTTKTLSSPPVTSTVLLETLLGLMLVLAIIAFLAWLLRRTGHFQQSANGSMRIISSLALGPRERAVLLQVGDKQVLVGVTTQQINTLHVLEQNIEFDNTKSKLTDFSFADKLQQIMKQREQS